MEQSRVQAVRQWLVDNGLDLADIPNDATWTIDRVNQTITIDKLVRDGNGQIVAAGSGRVRRETVTVPLCTPWPGDLDRP